MTAYALQGGGAAIIQRIDGDPTTVVGLPLGLLQKLLTQCGYSAFLTAHEKSDQ